MRHYSGSVFQTAGKILFGNNSLETIGELLIDYHVSKTVIVTDRGVDKTGLINKPRKIIEGEGIKVEVIPDVLPEPPISLVKEIFNKIENKKYDLLIGIGGGSSLDVTKLLSVMMTNTEPLESYLGIDKIRKPGIPTLLIPTTAGTGSEATPNAIVTDVDNKLKIGVVSKYLFATHVILDPMLSLSLPPHLTASTGVDALTHSLESYISKKSNLLSDMFALKSINLIFKSLRNAYQRGGDLEARNDMLIGSLLGGMALTIAGTAAVHALAYPLGGRYGIPHGVANAMMLLPVMQYNMDAIQEKLAYLADVVGIGITIQGVREKAERFLCSIESLIRDIKIPGNLKKYGVEHSHLKSIAEAASKVTRLLNNNPKKFTVKDIEQLYEKLL